MVAIGAVNDCIDSNDINSYPHLMATITIRNLDDEIKRKLRLRAARHDRSMEAEARAILAKAMLSGEEDELTATPDLYLSKIEKARKLWNANINTDEVMAMTRGD